MTEFNTGDKVRALRDSASGGYSKGTIYTVARVNAVTVFTTRDDRGSTTNGWRKSNFELADEAPSKFWTITVLDADGKPEPAENPKVFNTRESADTVARIMAEKHPGETFVTLEAVAASVIPVHLATTVNL